MAALGPFPSAPRLAAGVSGGPHSLALALLARDWARALGGSLIALIAEHGLRPGSRAEAEATAARLDGERIRSRILPLGLAPGPALQARARAARLAALESAAAEAGAPWLLLGHHRDDRAETLLLRLLGGSGAGGLPGLSPARAAPRVLLLRPLLGVAPETIEAWLSARGLVPLRDPSNEEARFARVRLRAALSGEAAGRAALAGAAEALARRREGLAASAAARLAGCCAFRPGGWALLDGPALGRDAVSEAALSALLRAVSGRPHPPPRGAVAAMLARGGGTLSGALWRGRLVCREPAALAPPVPAGTGALWDGRWRVVSAPPGSSLGALRAEGRALPEGTRRGVPAAALAGLPALRDASGALLAVPPLGWPEGSPWRLAPEPRGGPPLA